MQAAAITSRILTGNSSIAGFADSESLVTNDGVLRHIVASHLIRTVNSQELFLKLTNALIQFAEQAYLMRDLAALEEMSRVLMNLPVDTARQKGLYFQALAINRKGQREEAERLLQTIANDAPITYRARAIQTLGGNLHDTGQLEDALRYQLEALKAASDKDADGLQTTLKARFEIAIITSLSGNHSGALSQLETLWPIVNYIARQYPFYLYLYHNEVAVELAETGRIEEAKAACNIALASPFAPAYPEWAETRQELDAKYPSANPSTVAVHRAPEPKLATQADPQRKTQLSSAHQLDLFLADYDFFQRSTLEFPAKTSMVLNPVSIPGRMLTCIGPRAPPI